MKRAMLVLLLVVGCGKNGGTKGSGGLARQYEDAAQRADHGELQRPIGQR